MWCGGPTSIVSGHIVCLNKRSAAGQTEREGWRGEAAGQSAIMQNEGLGIVYGKWGLLAYGVQSFKIMGIFVTIFKFHICT